MYVLVAMIIRFPWQPVLAGVGIAPNDKGTKYQPDMINKIIKVCCCCHRSKIFLETSHSMTWYCPEGHVCQIWALHLFKILISCFVQLKYYFKKCVHSIFPL